MRSPSRHGPKFGHQRGTRVGASEVHQTSSLPHSRVDIEIEIDREEDERDSPSPSTSSPHPSLSLTASVDPAAYDECALLVLLYNLERRRAQRISKRVLDLFRANPELAKTCEAILPGLTLRLQRNPEGAYEALSSFEVLIEIVRVISADEAGAMEQEIKAMVSLHAANVGTREREALRFLPETPMWQSILWKAMNTILGRDILTLLTNGEGNEGLGDGERAVLRLRCNSKTAGQGLPMTVSARIELDATDKVQEELKKRLSGSYFGKSLAQISTSVWTSLALSRDQEVAGVLHLGTRDEIEDSPETEGIRGTGGEIQISSVNDLDAITMALAYLTGDGSDGGRNHRGKTWAVRDKWVPADARIRFSRSRGKPGESTYRVMVDDAASTIHAGHDVIDGLIDTVDALRLIDPQFVVII